MSHQFVIDLSREAILTALMVAMPMLVIALAAPAGGVGITPAAFLGEETENATDKKRQGAREEGQLAKSPELMTAALRAGMPFLDAVTGSPVAVAAHDTVLRMVPSASPSRLGA